MAQRGTPPLIGAAALNQDYRVYREVVAPRLVAEFRLDPHDELTHPDFLHIVLLAVPLIEAARRAKAAAARPIR